MKNKSFITTLGLLLLMGIGWIGLTAFRSDGLRSTLRQMTTDTQTVQRAIAQAVPNLESATQVVGEYNGTVKLEVTVAGLFSDTLNTQTITDTPDLGSIDLSLSISQTGTALSGYVSLDRTLVFSAEHTIQKNGVSLKTGPTISGSFDGTTVKLLSERVSIQLGGQSIQRQFQISGTISQSTDSQSSGSQFSGQYRETLWGATREPVTVIGTFTLQRPTYGDNTPDISNKAPETTVDNATTAQGTAITINVLANDSDSNGDALTITSVSKPQFGTATTNGQSVTYTPNATFAGSDIVTYFVSDGKGGTTAGTLTLTVTGDNQSNGSSIYLPLINR